MPGEGEKEAVVLAHLRIELFFQDPDVSLGKAGAAEGLCHGPGVGLRVFRLRNF